MTPRPEAKPFRQFEVGKVYSCRSICDSDCIFEYAVIDRTAKTIWTVPAHNGVYSATSEKKASRVKFNAPDMCEVALPEGRYSMCPIIRATQDGAPAKMAPIRI